MQRRQLYLSSISAACLTVFAGFALYVAQRRPAALDSTVLLDIHHHASRTLDRLFLAIAHGGDAGVVIGLVIAIVAILMHRRDWYRTVFVLAAIGGAGALNIGLKAVFMRPRPLLWPRLVVENSYSFPSGHAMASTALAVIIIALCWRTKYRISVIALCAIYIALVGFSRLYLGVHYPSDVLAGWLLSTAWVAAVAGVITTRKFRALLTTK